MVYLLLIDLFPYYYRQDGETYHIMTCQCLSVSKGNHIVEIDTKKFAKFSDALIKASSKQTSKRRGNNTDMYVIGATTGAAQYPKMYCWENDMLKSHMLLRPNVCSRPGMPGNLIQEEHSWFWFLVRRIEDVTLNFLGKLANQFPYYDEVLSDLLFVKNNFPEELTICGTCFTQQILLLVAMGVPWKEIIPHFDVNDLFGAVLLIGKVKRGSNFVFYGETKCHNHEDPSKSSKTTEVLSLPFANGLLVIGPFDKLLHSISTWDGTVYFLNLHTSRSTVNYVKQYGWNAYYKFAKDGFPQGDRHYLNFDL